MLFALVSGVVVSGAVGGRGRKVRRLAVGERDGGGRIGGLFRHDVGQRQRQFGRTLDVDLI